MPPLVSVVHGERTEIAIQDARSRFRSRAFRQKGLSTTMNDSATAAEQITGIAAAEQLDRRREIDAAIMRIQREIATALRNQTAFWQMQLEHRRATDHVRDLQRRIASIAQRLAKEGVQQETLDVIAQTSLYDRAKNYQTQVNRARSNDTERLRALKNNFWNVRVTSFAGAETFPEIKELDEATETARTNVLRHIDTALAEMHHLGEAYVSSLGEFEARDAEFKVKLDAAVAAQATHKQLLDESARLTDELRKAEADQIEKAEQEEANKIAPDVFNAACAELDWLLSERIRVLSEAALKVANQTSQMLKAKWKADPRPREYIDALLKVMNAARIHHFEAKSEAWVQTLRKHDAAVTWNNVRSRLLAIYKAKIAAGSPTEPSEEQANDIKELLFSESKLSGQQTQKIFQNLNDDALSAVFAATPRDYIVLTYVDQGGDIEFAKASPGQQASALLELLLRQSAGTLIIDQPEDDLDNRIIMPIVALIRKSKDRRQLLFTTHNPNIVVNGDADKVIALQSGDSSPDADREGRVQIDVDAP
jgi:chromosome segregation protein